MPREDKEMATERKSLSELLKLACKLPINEQLELIAELSARLAGRKNARTRKTWMEMAGLGADIWKGIDVQEYIKQERASWED